MRSTRVGCGLREWAVVHTRCRCMHLSDDAGIDDKSKSSSPTEIERVVAEYYILRRLAATTSCASPVVLSVARLDGV